MLVRTADGRSLHRRARGALGGSWPGRHPRSVLNGSPKRWRELLHCSRRGPIRNAAPGQPRRSRSWLSAWLFIASPHTGAAVFGLPAPEGHGAAWVAVVGLRDLAFGGNVLALALLSIRHAVDLVLGTTVLIPLGDVLVLLAVRGFSSPGQLLLHLASAGLMAAAAAWLLRSA